MSLRRNYRCTSSVELFKGATGIDGGVVDRVVDMLLSGVTV